MAGLGIAAVRHDLRPLCRAPTGQALASFLLRFAGYAASLVWVLVAEGLAAKLAGGLAAGFCSGLLFLIAHDACHGSYTARPWLNAAIGRLAFLASWHPYSLWAFGHNRMHHAFTNLAGRDFVWTPLSKQQYDALGPAGRWLQRLYRAPGGLGFGVYYLIEIWWKWMIWPSPRRLDRPRRIYLLDRLLAGGFIALLLLAPPAASLLRGTAPDPAGWALDILCLTALPMAYFSWVIGFVIYFNHTHPQIPWFARETEWSYRQGQVQGTVSLCFPRWSQPFMSKIMNHPAHHVEPGVPLCRLEQAEERLEQLLPGEILVQPWTLREHLGIIRRCKLYDYERHQWTDFAGRPTGALLLPR